MVRSNVKNLAESFFANFETRARRKEKDAFIERTKEGFREIGYTDEEMMIQSSRFGGKNLVVGSPDADFLLTAHYDTPGRNGWMLMPFAKTLGMGLSSLAGILLVAVLFFLAGVLWHLVGFELPEPLHQLLPLGIFILLLIIPNRHNHNDNTSGCLGVYNVATIIADNPELREKCAFVLFDMEELGLLGSGAFVEWRKKHYSGKGNDHVINLDCIGDGDLLVLASKSDQTAVTERAALAQFFQAEGFETMQKTSSLFGYLSDHAHFSKGVMLAFLRRSKLGGLYIPNIHTSKDVVCDLERIERLSASVVKYVSEVSK